MIAHNRNQTPAMEKLLDNNQETAKVKQFMSEVYKSAEKLKITKRVLEQKLFLFQIVEKPELVEAILDRDEPDPELEELINVQEPKRKFTALHLAVEKNSLASSSSILKAANYKLKLDGEGLPPALERLFQEGTVSEIKESLVRGLVEKIRMKSLHPDEALRCLRLEHESSFSVLNLVDSNCWSVVAALEGIGVKIATFAPRMGVEFAEWLVVKTKEEDWDRMKAYNRLTRMNKEGKTALSRLGMQRWSEANMWTSKLGLLFSIDDTELKEAIEAWSKTHLQSGTEEEAALVRQCIQEKGAVVKLVVNSSNDLRTAVERWNEKNKTITDGGVAPPTLLH